MKNLDTPHPVKKRQIRRDTRWCTRYVRGRRNLIGVAGAIALVAFGGYMLLKPTHAATFNASGEAEAATRSGNVSLVSDATASGSSALKFGGSSGGGAVSCDQAGIQQLVNSVSATTIEANLRKLVQDDSKPTPNELISRHISQPGNMIKVNWAKQKYRDYGLQVVDMPFTAGGKGQFNLDNVVGRLVGSTTPDTIYSASGHIDSINSNTKNATNADPAPGAEDDGTGTMAALEAGRVMVPFKHCLKSTLDFIGFNDEENSYAGVDKYITTLPGKTMKAHYDMDMVGYAPQTECVYNYYKDAARDKPLADLLVSVNSRYNIGLNMSSKAYKVNDVDASEFWKASMPALFENACISDENYPAYHSTTDSVSLVNFSQVAKMTKVVVAAMAEQGMQ